MEGALDDETDYLRREESVIRRDVSDMSSHCAQDSKIKAPVDPGAWGAISQ